VTKPVRGFEGQRIVEKVEAADGGRVRDKGGKFWAREERNIVVNRLISVPKRPVCQS